ncbi:uncharacterized protein LOC131255115 [Magnolia sinica]|uniref:uncharacterized protein LOC131255115 n=1 Tax=Magnolia sinica TaxID=86752 RepID=UPI00265848DF|nr:uncharacterized protein LOC131255115 [Magnolia sinica]
MVPIRITSLLLGFLLGFVSVSDSIANAQQDAIWPDSKADGNRLVAAATGGVVVVDQQVHSEHDAATVHVGKKSIKGRKMMKLLKKDEAIKEEGVNGGAPKMNSGKGKDALKKLFGRSQMGKNEQNCGSKMKPMALHSVDIEIAKTTSNTDSTHGGKSESSSRSSISQEPNIDHVETVEQGKLLKAAIETMNMLTKDYSQRPHRKPPINNVHPLSGKMANP